MKELLLLNRVSNQEVQWEYSPVCYDEKIHIRLRNFNTNKMIMGFENKLNFLLVYLINNYLKSLEGKAEFKADIELTKQSNKYDEETFVKYIVKFKQTDEFKFLFNTVCNKYISCKDIRIAGLYSKKEHPNAWDSFGHISPNLLPKTDTKGLTLIANFTKVLGITLQQYLFNDNYILMISNYKFKNPNTKFENKLQKKIQKTLNNNLKETTLWE